MKKNIKIFIPAIKLTLCLKLTKIISFPLTTLATIIFLFNVVIDIYICIWISMNEKCNIIIFSLNVILIYFQYVYKFTKYLAADLLIAPSSCVIL